MSRQITRRQRVVAVSAATAVVALVVSGPADAADTGDVKVVNTETVQVYMSPSGNVQTQRVYEQLALSGKGKVNLTNPVSTKGLRDLSGFSGFDVKDGAQVVDTSVDGDRMLRSVSDFDGKLPLKVSVRYTLDGKLVEPADVVGAAGHLEVTYTVENVTGVPQELSFDDGNGRMVKKTVVVPVPMVGSVTTTLPGNFRNVASHQANMAGDGRGGTKLSFTMTLFPPIGSTTANFGYTADITDGTVPRADVSALPVNPLESPTFAGAAKSYEGGASTGAELVAGASTIDGNLLKLRDGAADLLAGLIKLNDGADQLREGLAGTATPGAVKLADGAEQLDDGLVRLRGGAQQLAAGTGKVDSGAAELADGSTQVATGASKLASGTTQVDRGAGQLSSGAGRLAVGAHDAATGGETLTAGLQQIDGGLEQLADGTTGLPAAEDGIKQLQAGIDQILAGFGDTSDPQSLIGGLGSLSTGLGTAHTGALQLAGGLRQLQGSSGLAAAKGGVDQVQVGLAAAAGPNGSIDQLLGGLSVVRSAFCPQTQALANGTTCDAVVAQLLQGATASKDSLGAGAAGLAQVSQGLSVAIGGLTTQLIPGADALASGIAGAQDGAGRLKAGADQAKAGVAQVGVGLDSLAVGVTKAVSGVMALSDGASDAYAGSSQLSDGLGQLDAGAGTLAGGARELADGTGQLRAGAGDLAAGAGRLKDGAGRLAAGAGQLDTGANTLAAGTGDAQDGSAQLRAGAHKLAFGLQSAADGSGQLAFGLDQAADGAPKLVDGAQQLSDKGTKKLVAAGMETTQTYGEMVAVMHAGAQRAEASDMAYGAPADAIGLTAYNYILRGDDGEGGRNMARALSGLVILGAGAGVFFLRRRII